MDSKALPAYSSHKEMAIQIWAVLLALLGSSDLLLAKSEVITTEQRKFFESKIRPVLAEYCYECHATGAKKIGGDLYLDSAPAISRGGESGPPIVPGDPGSSLLLHALHWDLDLEMPPKEPLSERVIADFEKWIAMGAPDPRTKAVKLAQREAIDYTQYCSEDLWSFQPLNPQPPPTIPAARKDWPLSPIDHFVLASMEEKGLSPGPEASPTTLIRRLSMDLTGLPPTYDDVHAFAQAWKISREEALTTLVDELLASPHFGERWGRHWLDVARYAESNGNDGLSRNASFPHAWRYRDYVIRSFNQDLPYDQFIHQQLAGDLLEASSPGQRDDHLIATGFLALGSKPAKAMNHNFAMDVVADQIDVVGSAFLGLSIACARCHDHKTDPIPTRDYYAMAGFFTSTETLWGIAANEKLTAPPTPLHVLASLSSPPPPPEALQLMEETEAKEMRNYPRPKKEHTYPPGTALAMG
ncbi:MAG: DUF1549 domain-containing protein, partial [Verrucomicrobiota bacterium]